MVVYIPLVPIPTDGATLGNGVMSFVLPVVYGTPLRFEPTEPVWPWEIIGTDNATFQNGAVYA